jgi:hypothetical protein
MSSKLDVVVLGAGPGGDGHGPSCRIGCSYNVGNGERLRRYGRQ